MLEYSISSGPGFAPLEHELLGMAPIGASSDGRRSYPVRRALRAAVDEVHERLHLAPVFVAIEQGRVHPADYADLLRRLHHYHQACVLPLRRGHERLGSALFHDRAQLIRSDLHHLGVSEMVDVLEIPSLSDDECVGFVYAVEGSLLGGRVINRQLDCLFGDGNAGRSFFACKPEPSNRWHLVCAALERHGAALSRRESMCRGALRAFNLMEDCLSS